MDRRYSKFIKFCVTDLKILAKLSNFALYTLISLGKNLKKVHYYFKTNTETGSKFDLNVVSARLKMSVNLTGERRM